jgi:hypothetical protein
MAATASMSVAADFSGSEGFIAAAGGEYQFISQEYFNAVLDTTSLDPVEIWRLNQERINDFIFRTSLGYGHKKESRRAHILTDLEVSQDRLLGRAEGFYQHGRNENHFRLFGKFESRLPSDDDLYRADEYVYYQTYFGGRRRLGNPVNLNFRIGYEQTIFSDILPSDTVNGDTTLESAVFFNYDYSLIFGWAGGEFVLSELTSELTWRAGYYHRQVPDSAEMGYNQYRFSLGYLYLGLKDLVSLDGEIEFRDYMQPLDRDDFWALNFRGRLSRSISAKFEAGMTFISDIYKFEKPDIVNQDYALLQGELDGTLRIRGFGWGPITKIEYRREESAEDNGISSISGSSRQWEAGMHMEFTGRGTLFFNADITLGHRKYLDEAAYLSSYNLWAISVIANYSLYKNISFNLMFDGTFERHQVEEDDTKLYFLLVGITARI